MEFFAAVVNKDLILQLKAQFMTLDDSNPDKWLFLSSVSMIENFLKFAEGWDEYRTAHCLKKELIQAMCQDQYVLYIFSVIG